MLRRSNLDLRYRWRNVNKNGALHQSASPAGFSAICLAGSN